MKPRRYFPFKQGYPSVATLRVGSEGIQMTVDGKHITSFAFREVISSLVVSVTCRIFWICNCSLQISCLVVQTLEPWLVSEVRISGDLKLVSVLVSGLPTSEDSEHAIDLEALKAPLLSPQRSLDLFVGVFSTANNFKQRMAVRRTWMQYAAVRSGAVAVRFFVGLVSFACCSVSLSKRIVVMEMVWFVPLLLGVQPVPESLMKCFFLLWGIAA